MAPAQPSIIYVDVTNDPSAEARLTDAPDLKQDLHRLGFRRIGLLEARMTGPGWEMPLRAALDPEDAELMISRIQQGELTEITSVAGRTPAFGVVDWFFGALVTFETILENGVVVETTMKPARSPRPRGGRASSTTIDPVTQAVFRLLLGKPPEWSHPNCPAAGYFVELVNTRDTAALWQRHEQRVAEQAARYHTTARAHDSLAVYRAIRLRFQETQAYKGRVGPVIINGLTILVIITMGLSPFLLGRDRVRAIGLVNVLLAVVIVAILLFMIALVFAKYVIPNLPVPLTPLDRLLAHEARNNKGEKGLSPF